MSQFHTAIIGSGSGGLTVAVGLSKLGKKVALLEKHQVGGDCTNVGCIPSKTLIHGSYSNNPAKTILSHVQERRDHLREEEEDFVEDLSGVTFLRGQARFAGPNSLRVTAEDGSEETISAKNIVIATGSRPRQIEVEGLPRERVLTNESIFDLDENPKHLAIVGGGVIGLEMAFAFRRLGSEVTLLDRGSRVLKVCEPEVSELLRERLREEGIALHLESSASSFEESSQRLTLGGGVTISQVDKVLVAAGRIPNLDLDLEAAGVEFDGRGIPTDPLGQTNVSHIFAIGDVNHRSAFTHSANHQGRRLVRKLAFGFLPDPGPEPHYPSATFTDPEVAQVGPTLAELHKQYRPEVVRTQLIPLKDTDRGYTMGIQHGFVLIHCLALTGRILSATIVAPAAGEMISLLTFCLTNKQSMYKLADLVFPYPVLSEAVKKAASNFVFGTLGQLPKELYSFLRYRWL